MNTNDILKILYLLFFGLAAVSFVSSIIIFFKFRIIEVIQDLNGTLAKRQIEQMRARNENNKNYGDLLDADMTKTGRTNKTGRMGRTGRMGATGLTSVKPENASQIAVSSLQDQIIMESSNQNGTTILQSNRIINQNFVMLKSIVYVNTSEII